MKRQLTNITFLAALGAAASFAMADTDTGELTTGSETWDRISATGATITGSCDAIAPDSINNMLPYELFYFSPTTATATLDVLVHSLEATPMEFDPFVAVYCSVFDPNDLTMNLLHVDDDSGGYPDAHALNAVFLDQETTYVVVVSSYSSWASSQFGGFEVVLGADLGFIDPCPADLDGDDALNIFDVLAFLDAFNAGDPAADFTGDGNFNIFDVLAFLDAFNAGCP